MIREDDKKGFNQQTIQSTNDRHLEKAVKKVAPCDGRKRKEWNKWLQVTGEKVTEVRGHFFCFLSSQEIEDQKVT